MPVDMNEAESLLIARMTRGTPEPREGLADRMIRRAIESPRRHAFVPGIGIPRFAAAAVVLTLALGVGLSLNLIRGEPPSIGTGQFDAPLQMSCEGLGQRSGCTSVGVGLPLSDFRADGWNYRCQGVEPGLDCFALGADALLAALPNLGDAYVGPRLQDFGSSRVPFRIEFDGEPALRWRSAAAAGESAHVSVDFTQFALGTGPAFALIGNPFEADAEDLAAYELPAELARALLESFFVPVTAP